MRWWICELKGEGLGSVLKRYQGEGWACLQVLQTMQRSASADSGVAQFAKAAHKVLTARFEAATQGAANASSGCPAARKRPEHHREAGRKWHCRKS